MLFLRKRFLLTLALLVLWLFLFNLPPFSQSDFSRALRRGGVLLVYPFEYSFSAAVDFSLRVLADLSALRSAQRENQVLKQQIEELKIKNQVAEGVQAENEALRAGLGFGSRGVYGRSLLAAEVVARPPALFFQSILVNKGRQHGVTPDLPVVVAEGLVGRVAEVFDFSSRIVLLLDSNQAVSVKDQNRGDFGVAEGTGGGLLLLRYVPNQASVAAGDLIVTSGLSDVYPPHIPVGKVESVVKQDFDLFQQVKVRPTVAFSRLKQVFILK